MNQADALIENAYLDLRPKLLAYFSRQVKERAVAEDLLHDVFVRAQTHADQLRRPEQFEGWIFGIARNALLDWHRRRRPTLEIGQDLPAPAPEDPPPDLSASVRWFILQLPMLYRAPLVLVELRGLSVKEAAARLEISYTAAKSRVRRARRLLLEAMLRCCRFEADAYGNIIDCAPRPESCEARGCEPPSESCEADGCGPSPRSGDIRDPG